MPNTTSQQNKVSGKKRYSIFSLLAEKYGKLEKQQLLHCKDHSKAEDARQVQSIQVQQATFPRWGEEKKR